MNQIVQLLFSRKSTRDFLDKPIANPDKDLIVDAAIQAPSAGNQVLYTILEIDDQRIKQELSELCDNQPFIAKAPYVLIFLADCRKWLDCYHYAGIEARKPELGDMLLACEDAAIAAQNAVIAAESLGIGSCYIGDILENKEKMGRLLDLDNYVLPISMLVFGYPTERQKNRIKPKRFSRKFIVQKNTYKKMSEDELRNMFEDVHVEEGFSFDEYIKAFCVRKYMSGFSREMNRSTYEYLKTYIKTEWK
ncbi:MAG: nitroreductase [Spirochaetae bacterium HGW-Spirochaetae-7]|nr:MAG: nitroreductase [Spirochaetae bacterium HGW-Spirochaetae-7]